MNLKQLLENLSVKNVELWVDGEKLRYRAPENSLNPELLGEIQKYKPEIIRILSQGSDHGATYPLSHGQRALWFLYQLALESVAYNATYAARLITNLDIPALKQAAQALVERHPVLRTTFTTIDGEPVQTVHEHHQVDFSVEEVFALGQDEIKNWLSAASNRPFDLETGPILRFNLLINHSTTKEHILLITQHHIVSDFWSLEIMLGEIRILYEAITKNIEPLLPAQNCQYRDYVKWSEQMLTGSEGERLWTYWQQQLSGKLPVLNLPTDRPRPQSQTYNGASCFFSVEEKLLQKLTELALKEGASLYTVLLTTLQILLLRYTNQEDILIGSPMVNRSRSDLEKIVGYFTNPVVLRADLSGNPTFEELLGRSRSCVLNALEHQEYPFPLLVERLQPVRDPSFSPLYQVALAWDRYRNHQNDLMDSDGLIVESMMTGAKGAAFDLTLTILEMPVSLKGTWNYNTDLFDSSTIERMTGHFLTLLEAIVANPQERISQLPMLTASEQQQLLVEWNDTRVDYPQDKCIHHLFEEQVERTPDAVAVVFDNQQLTYGELNSRANQLAHYLRSLDVGADVLVGICLERSLLMIVGLLSILKAGGAYVPLDPEYPQDRLNFMLEDAQVSLLLTQQRLVDRLPEYQAKLVCLDQIWEKILQNKQDNPRRVVAATDLANVIYTSGSTGNPKGVMVEHRGLCNLAQAQIQAFGLHSDSRVLQFASLSFDACISEVVMTLASGATLYLGTKDALMPGMLLIERLRDCLITHITLPPSALAVMPLEKIPALQTLIVAGEACAVELMWQWSAVSNFFNAYGPTEASVCATIAKCTPFDQKISIGRPIANTQVYILDKYLQPVPVGVPGELHIGGAGLARGYLNRPELTREKFLPNVFSDEANSRLYKTGDLGRYLPSGNIEYLGRIDNQVKIRGFRIELGEIEAVLSQQEEVQSSVVMVREDTPGNKRLVAYIVWHPEMKGSVSELLRNLKEKLPEYMVPNRFVFLEALPLTPNGKIDRRALPVPDRQREGINKYVAPRTPTEEMLAQVWTQVLKIEPIGRHENFFTLGGHSLLAMQVVSRIRNIFKVELPLRSLFATATVAELAQSIQQLQQEKVELKSLPILPRTLDAEIPLSFAQQRLWFLDQLQPLGALYNIPITLRMVGKLNVAAYIQSLEKIIQRHEALRTNFITVDGKATQIIQGATDWRVSVVDLQHLSTTEQERASKQLAQQQAIQPFDLATQPLVRATLVVLSETEHVLNVCMHHIVSDGWSIGVLVEELAALYNADALSQPSPLAPLPIQYADFAMWQRQWLQGEVLERQLSYWVQQLANAPTFLPLPTDRPRPAVQTFNGAHLEFGLSEELTQGLTKLSQEQGVTLFMTLLAALKTLLYRYTGVADILVGSPIANRNHSEIESLIGFFVNTLVLRTDISGNPSFNELLTRVRSMALSAYGHQDLPFEMLVEALQPERDLSHTPLFQVMFMLQNGSMSEVELTGLTVSPLKVENTTAKFDLTLAMENRNTGLVGVWEYNTDLFDSSRMERMTGHFLTLLEAIVANPQGHVAQLPMLTASEQQQLLVEWNDTRVDYPQDKCIHQLFEAQVERTPDAVAVVDENQHLTYGELNSRANKLAHYLQSLGVSADVLVGLCVERSLSMVVGLLGILKAGGAYVPLDPTYPQERLSFMLEDAQARVLVTQQQLVEKLPEHQAQIVYLDPDHQELVQGQEIPLVTEVKPSNLAYVLYTSGSTGRPKAVAIEHHSPVALAHWAQLVFTPNELAGVLASTSICFDLSVFELFVPLTMGGKAIIAENALHLSTMTAASQVTLINTVPSAIAELIRVQNLPQQVCTVNLAGEALQNQLVQQIYQHSKTERVFNLYGPSEDTTYSTYSLIEKGVSASPTIGRPIANTQVYILDKYLQPVPVGVPGELHIGGAGLARGYRNRPELTKEKFLPNGFSDEANSRLYKTGDLGRYLSDGNIEYLGRIDNQVKIRGFRIELGEIEAVLSQQKEVQSSVVMAREDTPGNKRLVAYIVWHPEMKGSVSELLRNLKEKLPEYMVPNRFVFLEALPLTPNGKIDRRALPVPDRQREGIDKYVAPRTPTEEMLAQVWTQVLKIEPIGRHENFFTLGGHSLLAMQVVSRIRNIFKVELPLRSLFATATVAELAQSIQELQQEKVELKSPPILPRTLDAEIPLSFAQQRLWFLDQLQPLGALYNIPMALRMVGKLNVGAYIQSLEKIIHRHEALRTNFITVDGKAAQIIQDATDWRVSVVDLQHLSTTEQERASKQLAQQQATQPFDLSSSALLRATLVVLSETEHVLNVCMHHIVSDGWSIGVLVEELAALYNAEALSQPSPLAPLPIQYADFAMWQRQWLQGEVLERQLSYWVQQLANAPTFLPLPTDRPRPAVQTFNGAHLEFGLSEELTQGLTKLSQEQGVTLFMTLLAALKTLLYRYTGVADILVGSPIANRNHSEIESLIGFFVNTLVLRTDISGNPSFNELLTRVRSMALSAYGHQDLPFEMLVEALQPERDLSHTPLFQVMFMLQNGSMSEVELTGLTVSPLKVENTTAKFDLTLAMENKNTGLVGVWEYNTDLFDSSRMERMTGHFLTLLEAIVANPQEHVAQLPMLTASEQQQLLVEWNDTRVDYPQDKCIHQLFEAQVERTPDAVAGIYENQHLTYGELNSRANQLAHYLQSLGVSADVLVGLCVERSLSMVVGLLGILKAGGAYVPLDPTYPQERLSFMLEDAQARVLVTQQQLVEKLPEHQAQIVYLDPDHQELVQGQEIPLVTEVKPSNLAYILYTSGSTGRPKAVAIEHHSPVALAHWAQLVFTPNELAGVLASTSICFDLSVFELFVPLTMGGKAIIAENALHLSTMTAASQVTLINTVPSAIAELIRVQNLPQQVCTVNLAGEALQNQLVQQIYQHSKTERVFNLYGPSEDTTYSTYSLIEKGVSASPTIGRPIANTQVYILDKYLQPVPVGVPGELHIGGAGLARGYLNRPELTREKFLPNVFSDEANSRLYKTGDLGRYLPSGNIEYLGRIDNQVKIRGFRIELGEIEAVLSQQEEVQSSVVMVREDTPGNKRLVAYIVWHPEMKGSVSELLRNLKEKLPEYMVPNRFVFLEALPLTPNGKIDRRALPVPDRQREGINKYVAPRTPTEEMLAQVWTQVLKIEPIGRHENFFTLGGHSLLAMQVVSRIRNIFKVELPLRSLFATATVAELAQSIQELQQEKVELKSPPILPRTLDAEIPLSFAQQRLWFLDQLQPLGALYNIPMALRMVGKLNVGTYIQSLEKIIQRHEALRTNFITVDGKATQIIQGATDWRVSVVDLQHLSTTEQERASKQLAQQQAIQPFDLATQPLVRATLVVLSETEHVLNVCMHHIVSDGWSIGVLVEELAALYNAEALSQPSPLAPLPIQYADFAMWQRQWLQGEVLERQLSYWVQQLANAPTFLPLPTDRPRPAVQTFNGAHLEFGLSEELTQGLTKLSQEQGVTLFMTLLAALKTLLYRYTGVADILVGSPIANRNHSEIESLIGFFVNTLVLRTDISGNPSFNELLTRVRSMALSAYGHQDLPFEMLVEALQPERDLSHTPLFQVMFMLQNGSMSEVELTGLTVSPLKVENTTAKFDLTLAMENRNTGLVGVWEYNTDLFDSSRMERMTGHFLTLLEAIVANPQGHVAQLPMLTASEQQQLLVEWNDTRVDYPQDKCIHQLFEAQVERTPDAVAGIYENQHLTYGELNSRANQLAHYLQSLGVSADVLVGLCVERSLSMLVGLLGILKAGGAYVPLDPTYPQERLSFMLEDAQVSVLLAQKSLLERLPEHQAQLVCLNTDWQLISQLSHDNLITEVQATNLAYVIYTSGSTGQPKGVEVIHRGVNRLLFGVNYVDLDATQRFLQMAPISFDASTFEIWGALLHGGLCVIFPESIPTSKNLGDEIAKHGITVLWLTAALFNSIIDEHSQGLSGIRQLLIGGEALSVAHVQRASERLPLTQIINGYGPTESTTFTCCHPIPTQLERAIESIPIGRPIANTQVYILDKYLQPVPVGVPGELHIGGAGLARGYLNRPALTIEKFLPNGFSDEANSRLYKTGDLGRYLSDGNIEYLGRMDNQVKIRGFRIELGEIEAVLSQQEEVQSSVVMAREDTPGDKRLVAYIVWHPEMKGSVSELLRNLKEKLPEYMVPNRFVFLEALPLTPNGKIDRRALPVPERDREGIDKYVAPRTPTEEMLAQVWTQVLKIEPIGRHENFFSLGGHSLLAMQVVSRIRNIFKVELPLRSLFATATVAELAQSIQELQQEKVELKSPPILPRTLDAEIPLSFAQQRLWFLDQLQPLSASYNIPMALRIVGKLNVGAYIQSLEKIIHRHEALRTNFITVDGKPTQIIQGATDWRVSVVDLQHLSTTEQEIASKQLAQQQATQPFDLSSSALLRATLVVLSETEHVLILCMHHIVSDGWSIGVLVEELATLYNAEALSQPSPLAPLPIQYADFAMWQRQWLQGEVLERQLSYWVQQLANAPTFLPLPTDRPRPALQTSAGAHLEFGLSEELTQGLTKLSQEQGVTLFMTLLAALKTLLYRYTGVADILVGSPIANRNHSEIESLIGFFANTLVLRTDISGNPSFNELLTRVRSMALSAYGHQDLPFEMLVEALQPERDLSHTPLFQVMFVLQNGSMSEVELTGLTVSSLPIESATAKFDLTLAMENKNTGLVGVWEYNTDLFDSSRMERMTGHFLTLLEAIVANPQGQVAQLPMLTASEQQQLLVEWNDTRVDYPQDKCIHQLFEAQVERTPDAVAGIYENQHLTYGELNSRANQLAHYLQSLGVSADVLVGICVERSLEMVVGLLGILKAGGAYVPLDPTYPQERLSFMLENAQARVLVTQQQLVEKLPLHQAQLVCLDTDWQLVSQWSQDNLICGAQGNNLGYVIYTSGSTGQPKGVAMNQSALCNLILWQLQNQTISRGGKTLQFAPVSFDVSFQEMFSTWCSGGTLLLIPEELRREPLALLGLLQQQAVARLFLPFVGLQQLAEVAVGSESVTSHLREIITAGEQLQMTPPICNWLSQLTDCTLHNHYGPSESHVVTTFTLSHSANSWPLLPPIGRPIANAQIYILDQYLQPVPVGVPGELYIGGASLARGYFNRTELTLEKFIPNPFDNSKGQNSKLYKTGDLARYLPDGNIEYLGRIDNQIKIRGFRIELGEIEAVLSQHSGVRDTAVIARENIAGDKQLVAYVVPHQEGAPTIIDLRRFLKQRMPDYMVPGALVVLEALPLTPNGKIDRRALPAPDLHLGLEQSFVAPRTPIEQILASIWAECLGIEMVGVHDNFFELGGHSIKATQVMSQLRSAFKIELPLRSLFEKPTIAELAATIASTLETSATIVGSTQKDLNAEAVLDPTIQPHIVSFTYTREPKSIFLTGASGFLGTYLLYELLEQTQANIYCLVRSANEQQAKQKLQSQMESFQIWKDVFSSRIIPVVGDLSKKLLGLSAHQFRDLASEIDIIYHNGAWVSTVYSYSTLKAANVLGTQEVLRLASEIKLKPVHFVSTIGVFSSSAYSQMTILSESDPLEHSKDINNGYAESKWVGEKLVMSARDRGLPACIYRSCRIIGHSQTGLCNPDDFLSKLIPGCIQLGMVPKFELWAENIIPVDYMSRAIIHLSQQKESWGKAFHLVNPHSTPLNDLFNLIRSLGYPLKDVSYQQWRSHLFRTNQGSPNNVLQSLLAIFSEENLEITHKRPELDLTNTLSGLAGTDIVFPTIEAGLIKKYLSDFIIRGLVPKPTF